jgi:hypothetical protein
MGTELSEGRNINRQGCQIVLLAVWRLRNLVKEGRNINRRGCQIMLLPVGWAQNLVKEGTLTLLLLLVRLKAFTGVHQAADHLRWAGKNRRQLTCSIFPEYLHILLLPPFIVHFCILTFYAITPLCFDFIFPWLTIPLCVCFYYVHLPVWTAYAIIHTCMHICILNTHLPMYLRTCMHAYMCTFHRSSDIQVYVLSVYGVLHRLVQT